MTHSPMALPSGRCRQWRVEHAADVLNKFAVGIDGRTAYERIKGKSTMARWLSSGEE